MVHGVSTALEIKVQLDLNSEKAPNTILAYLSEHCLRISHFCDLQKLLFDLNPDFKVHRSVIAKLFVFSGTRISMRCLLRRTFSSVRRRLFKVDCVREAPV